MHTYSLSEEGFGYNCGRLKSKASHTSHENTWLRCGKNRKRRLGFCSDGSWMGRWMLLALCSVAPPAVGRLQAVK